MPIYSYLCADCGFEKDHLQKLNDPAIEACPQCGQSGYAKQITAAGFMLKGSGWYATDFKGGKAKNETPRHEPGPACAGCPGEQACAAS